MADDFRAGYQILRLRKLCGCSQEELAFDAGISPFYLRQIEHGDANPSMKILLDIFSCLYVQITGQKEVPPQLFAIDLFSEDLPMWRYSITPETKYDPDIGAFRTYGIQAEIQRRGVWSEVETLHDVTVYWHALHDLVVLLNHLQLSPLHLRDVVEEIL